MSQLPIDATCSKCGAPATLMCQRCMEHYCTSDCQILDWKEHKSKCHQMPQLIPIKKVFRSGGGGDTQMRRPYQREGSGGGGSHNDSIRRGNIYARNPLPSEDKDMLRDDKDFVLRPKVSVPPPAVIEVEIPLKTIPIVDGCNVYITRVLTHAEIFIAAANSKDYTRLFATLAPKCAAFAPEDALPAKGDFVLVNDSAGHYYRGEIIDLVANAYRVRNIDTGELCEDDVPLKRLRKLNNAVRSSPIQLQRVKLIYVESIPHALPGNRALIALEKCRANALEFEVKFDAQRSEVVDLLFLNNAAEKSLSKKILPMLFEKCLDSTRTPSPSALESGGCNVIKTLKSDEEVQRQTLPPSPPSTPVVSTKTILTTEFVSAAVVATSPPPKAQSPPLPKPQDFAIPDLDAEAGAAALPPTRIYTLNDLEIVPITVGDDIPIQILDSSSIVKGYITAADFSNKQFICKMEAYLANVSKYCKARVLENTAYGGFSPQLNEICLAVFPEDGGWYRAICLGQPKKKFDQKEEIFHVMFVDFGNICQVSKREVLPITKELMFPSNANMCYIDGLKTKDQCLAFFKATLANPIVSCKVIRRDEDDTYELQVNNLEKLVAE